MQTSHGTYYSPLVRWDVIDEILAAVEEDERLQTKELILKTLDHAVLDAVLEVLPHEHHEVFFSRISEAYHDPSLLEWLEEHHQPIRSHLQVVIQKTKQDIQRVITVEVTDYEM